MIDNSIAVVYRPERAQSYSLGHWRGIRRVDTILDESARSERIVSEILLQSQDIRFSVFQFGIAFIDDLKVSSRLEIVAVPCA